MSIVKLAEDSSLSEESPSKLDRKRQALKKLLQGHEAKPFTISRRSDRDFAPLAPVQRTLWFLNQMEEANIAYTEMISFEYLGHIDASVFTKALEILIERHETLRTVFVDQGQGPRQVILPGLVPDISHHDLTGMLPNQVDSKLHQIADNRRKSPFNLGQLPLFSLDVFAVTEQKHILLLRCHHMILDGWSMHIFLGELKSIHDAVLEGRQHNLPVLPIQYGDYSQWCQVQIEEGVFETQLDYWKSKLSNSSSELKLPFDYIRPDELSYSGGSFEIDFEPDITSKVRHISQQYGTSPFTVLLSGVYVWLHKVSNQTDIIIGCPEANRQRKETEGLLGFFANTLALRLQFSESMNFGEIIEESKQVLLGAIENQSVPFEMVVDAVNPVRSLNQNPLFQVLFNFMGKIITEIDSSGQITPMESYSDVSKFDLCVNLGVEHDEISGSLQFSTDLFSAHTAASLARSLRAVMRAVLEKPNLAISKMQFAPEGAPDLVCTDHVDGSKKFPEEKLLHRIIENQAEQTGDNYACAFKGERLTYSTLNSRANRIANFLLSNRERKDSVIGVCSERSIELLPALLGVLKAGAAYLPLDPKLPPDRLEQMIKDAKVDVVMTSDLDAIPSTFDAVRTVEISEIVHNPDIAASNPNVAIDPSNLAYVIYTSGSTGYPKGSMISHAAISNRLYWMQDEYTLQTGDRILQKTPLSFDVSVWELFWPLMVGAEVVFAEPEEHIDPYYIWQTICSENINVVHFVPTMLREFLDAQDEKTPASLNHVICSGEALPEAFVRDFHANLPEVELHNLYGPTEAAVDVTSWHCDDVGRFTVPIGRPIANMQVFILDHDLNIVPDGIVGELYIAGPGLSRGYLKKAGLTAERFIACPFVQTAGSRMYKTGDLARRGATGEVEFIGRIDNQVKIYGFRIELGEIEATLLKDALISQAVVLAKESDAGQKRVVAYIVPSAAELDKFLANTTGQSDYAGVSDLVAGIFEASPEAIRVKIKLVQHFNEQLKAILPEYMVPSDYVLLEKLPLTYNGKIDRKKLPEPVSSRVSSKYKPPVTPEEKFMAKIWSDVLKIDGIGVNDNFFELGGDSILCIKASTYFKRAGIRLSVKDIFTYQTVGELAKQIQIPASNVVLSELQEVESNINNVGLAIDVANFDIGVYGANAPSIEEIETIMPMGTLALDFYLQETLLDRADINLIQLANAGVRNDASIIERALEVLVVRHPILRTSYFFDDSGTPWQVVHKRGKVKLAYVDWREQSERSLYDKVADYFKIDACIGLAADQPVRWRVTIAQIGDDRFLPIFTFDYKCLDGWSMGIILDEYEAIYDALSEGNQPPENVDRPHFASYLSWLAKQDKTKAEKFWSRELEGFKKAKLPFGRAIPADIDPTYYDEKKLIMSLELSETIRNYVRRNQLSEYSFFLTAWFILTSYATDQEDVLVGVAVTGRTSEFPGIESMAGSTLNLQPTRMNIRKESLWTDTLLALKDKQMDMLDYEITSLQDIRKWCGYSNEDLIFDTMFYFQNLSRFFVEQPDDAFDELKPQAHGRTAYPLRFEVIPGGPQNGPQLFAYYYNNLFDDARVMEMLQKYNRLLASMAKDTSATVGELIESL